MTNSITKIAFVEDQPEVLNNLVNIFSNATGFVCRGQYKTAEEAIPFLLRSDADVVIVDIKLPGKKNGIDCVRQVKLARPEMQFIMYTQFEKGDELFESLKAGASGYLVKKGLDASNVIKAVKELLIDKGSPMSPAIARRLTNYFHGQTKMVKELKALTSRENELLRFLAEGLLYKEIASKMGITTGTVKQHINKIYKKIHVNNRTEAINLLNKNGTNKH